MSSTTLDFAHAAPHASEANRPSFFAKLQAVRLRQAERIVARHLARFSDDQLLKLGHSRARIAHLRRLAA